MQELTEPGEAGTPDDPSIKAEILLLLRLVLADGEAGARTAAVMRRIAGRDLGLDESGLDEVVAEIEHLVASVGTAAAGAALRSLTPARRKVLGQRLAAIAAADEELAGRGGRLRGRIEVIVDITLA